MEKYSLIWEKLHLIYILWLKFFRVWLERLQSGLDNRYLEQAASHPAKYVGLDAKEKVELDNLDQRAE